MARSDRRTGTWMLAGCASAWYTTACSPTPSAGPSAGTANLAERLARDGHEVTYLTLRQWDRGEHARTGRRARAGRERGPAHGRCTPTTAGGGSCRRSCSGWACWRTCCAGAGATTSSTRARSHTSRCSPPRRCARWGATSWWSTGSRCGADSYWREYLGGAGGRVGALVQRLCARVPPARVLLLASCTPQRLREEGLRGQGDGAARAVRRDRSSPDARGRRTPSCCSPRG